jgi:DNA-binding beta-propeller fold protein YncE
MPLRHLGFVELPVHATSGGFDHAAVHGPTGRIYVAHTANDAVDIIDGEARKYLGSIGGLTGVAGALVTLAPDLIFTSNRGENTVAIVAVEDLTSVGKVPVGTGPNGLAYDTGRGRLLVAHVGDPAVAGSRVVSVVDVRTRRRIADISVAGRTRWTVYDPVADAFHVNIADPPQIVVIDAGDPLGLRRAVAIPHAGPHGLDIDVVRRRLFCACDAGTVLEIDADTGDILRAERIAGVPDVVFLDAGRDRLYVAIGDPGPHRGVRHDAAPATRDDSDRIGRTHAVVRRDATDRLRVPARDSPRRHVRGSVVGEVCNKNGHERQQERAP